MIVPSEDVDTSEMEEAIISVKDAISKSTSETFRGLESEIIDVLNERRFDKIRPGCDLFKQRITKHLKAVLEKESMKSVRRILEARCQYYFDLCSASQLNVVNELLPFVRETSTILVLGQGSLVANAIACAVEHRPGVKFLLCEGSPSKAGATLLDKALRNPRGYNNRELLQKSAILVPDSAIAAMMPKVDFVVLGANCVTEHGGLVHSIGSLQVAMVADAMHIPVYVLSETFKFSRIFPLDTNDIKQPQAQSQQASPSSAPSLPEGEKVAAASFKAPSKEDKFEVPVVEFVPPNLISLVFTEQGIMPPSAVADEMFRIHTVQEATNL